MSRSTPQSQKRKTFYTCLIFALITVLLYWRTVGYEFIVVDDHKYVFQNGMVLKGLTWAGIKWAFTTFHASNWHPITWLSHMLDVSIYGLFAGGHHITSAAFHLANIILLFLVLKKITGAFWPSAFVAALFGWHPAHVESVAWVCERKDILSMFFMTLTLWAYGRYALQRTTGKYLATLGLFALGLMCKPMLVTLPCVLLLLDYWPLNRFTFSPLGTPQTKIVWQKLVAEKIPFFLLSLASAIVTVIAQHKGGAMQTLDHVSFFSRTINAVCAYGTYLEKAILPIQLAVFYPLPTTTPWGLFAVSVIVLGLVSYFVFRKRSTAPWLLVGWLWFLGTLVPVIGLVQVGNQAMADRYTYIPYIGLFIMIAWTVNEWYQRASKNWIKSGRIQTADVAPKLHPLPKAEGWGEGERRPIISSAQLYLIGGSLIVLLACTVLSAVQLKYWHDSIKLFTHALAVTPDNVFSERNLSYALSEARRGKEAIPHYYALLQLAPEDVKARFNLGLELLSADQPGAAEAQFSEALKYQPQSDKLHNNLGIALSQEGKLDVAAAEFEKAIQLNPQFPWPVLNYAVVLQKKGLAGAAITNYTRALVLQPDWAEAMDKLAFLLATCPEAQGRDPAKAVKLSTQANDLTQQKSPDFLNTLAVAYAATGDFTNALATAELAHKLAVTARLQPLTGKLETEIESYRSGKIPPADWKTPPASVIMRDQ